MPRDPVRDRWIPIQITAIYLVLGGVWLYCHDLMLGSSMEHPSIQPAHLLLDGLVVLLTGVVLYLLILRSVAALRRAARQVQESHARLDALLDTTVDGIITMDAEGHIESVNQAAQRIFGYEGSDLLGQSIKVLLRQELSELRGGSAGSPWPVMRRAAGQRRDGSRFPVEVTVSQVQLDGQSMYTGVVRDVSERQRAEEALRQSEERFRSLVEMAASVIICLDQHHTIVEWNRGAEEVFGWPRHEALGCDYLDLCEPPPPSTSAMREGVDLILAGQHPVSCEGPVCTRDGQQRLLSWSMTRLPDEVGLPARIIAIGQDITEKRSLEEQTAQSEKLAAIGQLAAGVAHEIGNPLASISTVAQNLRRKTSDTYVIEKLSLITGHIDRIASIVRLLVNFARPQPRVWRSVSVGETLRSVMGIVRYDKRVRNIALDLQLPPEAVLVHGVEDQLSQVFLNIALNALDALKDVPPERSPRLCVRAERDPNGAPPVIRIQFEDNGRGIEPEILPRIFEPFFTTKEVGRGTGLGLAVSYRIVQDHGGRILADSVPGEGACFTVELPVGERQLPER